MSKQEKYAYLLAICSRYVTSGRAQKAVILNEFSASRHLGRKYAIAQWCRFRRAHDVEQAEGSPQGRHERLTPISAFVAALAQRVGRKPVYAADAAVVAAIESIGARPTNPVASA